MASDTGLNREPWPFILPPTRNSCCPGNHWGEMTGALVLALLRWDEASSFQGHLYLGTWFPTSSLGPVSGTLTEGVTLEFLKAVRTTSKRRTTSRRAEASSPDCSLPRALVSWVLLLGPHPPSRGWCRSGVVVVLRNHGPSSFPFGLVFRDFLKICDLEIWIWGKSLRN